VEVQPAGLGLLSSPSWDVSMLRCAQFSTWFALAFFSFCLVHPHNFVCARWSLPTPEARCLRPSPSAGVLELLASCSGMLLAPKGWVLDGTTGRCLTTDSSLPEAEISTAGRLVALELPAR
jgi:hypothetical protein